MVVYYLVQRGCMLLENKLRAWADAHKGSQGELALNIANAMKNPAEMAQWSLIDIRTEFNVRAPQPREERWWVDPSVGALFLIPVGFAWFHLWAAFSQFRKASLALPEGLSIDFLTFWNKGYSDVSRQMDGMPISGVAKWVVVILLVIALLNGVFSYFDKVESEVDTELNDLILETSLALGKTRAIRPEEIADVLKESGQYLILGLDNLRDALSGTEKIVAQVALVSGSLSESAQRIDDATKGLQSSMAPLAEFSVTAKSAEHGLRAAGDTIREAAKSLATSVSSNVSGLSHVRDEMERVAQSFSGSRSGLDNVVDSASAVTGQVRQLSERFVQIIEMANQSSAGFPSLVSELDVALSKVNEFVARLDDPKVEPYVAVVHDSIQKMTDAVHVMQQTVAHMSTQLERWSEGVDASLT